MVMKETVHIPTDSLAGFTHIQLSAKYDKGEWREPRGYYLTVTAVRIDKMPAGYEMVTWASDAPYKKYLVEQVARKNAKRFGEFVEKMNTHAKEIAEAFVNKDYNKVWSYV